LSRRTREADIVDRDRGHRGWGSPAPSLPEAAKTPALGASDACCVDARAEKRWRTGETPRVVTAALSCATRQWRRGLTSARLIPRGKRVRCRASASGYHDSRPYAAARPVGIGLRDLDRMHSAWLFGRVEFDRHAERLKALRRQGQMQLMAPAERISREPGNPSTISSASWTVLQSQLFRRLSRRPMAAREDMRRSLRESSPVERGGGEPPEGWWRGDLPPSGFQEKAAPF
jgi:hypothetical protein